MASRSARKVPVSFYPTTLGRLDVKLPFPSSSSRRAPRVWVRRLGVALLFSPAPILDASETPNESASRTIESRFDRHLALSFIALHKARFLSSKKTRAPQRKRRRRKRRTVGISTLVASANSACNSSTVVDHGMLPTYKRLAGGEAGCCCSDIFFLSFFFFVFLAIFLCGILSFFLSMILGRRRKNNTKAKKTKARLSFDPFGKSLYLI